MSKSLVIVESP
ncbi:DNA topoisomerase 1, partial [Haemophilus influenzae]